MKQILGIVLIVAVGALGAVWFTHRGKRPVARGSAMVQDKAVAKGANSLGQGGSAATAGDAQQMGQAGGGQATEAGTTDETGDGTAGQAASGQAGGLAVPPTADSISRNPPNGMLFAGTGKYQLYRQGDITWRLDTDTGQACILFATDAQWKLARVYEHGCGTR